MKDNGRDGTARILRQSQAKTISAGFEQQLMHKVRALEHRRTYRKLILLFLLRFFVVTLLLILLVRIYLPGISGKTIITGIPKLAENSGQAAAWILEHIYLVIPFIALKLFRRLGHGYDSARQKGD